MEDLKFINSNIQSKTECITNLNNCINDYRKKIQELENQYDALKKYQYKVSEYINQYNVQVVKHLDVLDAESTFREYYKTKIDDIFHIYGNDRINDNVDVAKKNILNQIKEYEMKIYECKENIDNYENDIQKLKIISKEI